MARTSVRATMTKSGSWRAAAAAAILSAASSAPTTALLFMWPHFFGMIWSSSWMAATPARSYSCTVRTTLMALP